MLLIIIVFIVILGILVLAHELGHFLTARIFKVKAEEFGFGYPPRLLGLVKDNRGQWRWLGRKAKAENFKETVWSLNWFPIGGFVKIKGEDQNSLKEADSFAAKKIWQRAVMLVAGVLMNVLLCVILLSVGFGFGIPSVLDQSIVSQAKSVREEKIQVVSVNKDSPANSVGLQVSDELLMVDGNPLASISFLQDYVHQHANQTLVLAVKRDKQELRVEITPQILATSNGQAELGLGLVETGIVTYPWYTAVWHGLVATYNLLVALALALWGLLKNIVMTGEVAAEVAGPVGIAVLTGQVVQMGWVYVLQFTALLSLNLAIINILPIPALDGGRVLFLIIEAIKRKPVNARIEALVHNIGFALLMVLVLLVTYRDLTRWGGTILQRLF